MGTIPIARRVGGLADTVEDGVTGFLFDAFEPQALADAVRRAIAVYRDPARWEAMVREAMVRDFSLGARRRRRTRRCTAASLAAAAGGALMPMDFVLALHSHLPWVLHHGRWPHGTDWLCEAALDTYLPLLEELHGLAARGVAAPVTIGFTPVLAGQLAHPDFAAELDAFFAQRLAACAEARRTLPETGERAPRAAGGLLGGAVPAAARAVRRGGPRPHRRVRRARGLRAPGDHHLGGDARLPAAAGARREHPAAARGRRRPSTAGCSGASRAGCWLPECAYRPRGPWAAAPGAPRRGRRAPASRSSWRSRGCEFFFTDAHLAQAGSALGGYAEVPAGRRALRRRAARRRRGHRGDGARAHAVPGLPRGARPAAAGRSRRWCATRARRCRCGAGTRAIPATRRTSSSTRSAGPAASSCGA